ncbi:MAG: NAD(P)-binding protein [Thermodesulfobacteriota bacterium]
MVGLITIGISTYLILYSHSLYNRVGGWLKIFEHKITQRELVEETMRTFPTVDVILFGLGRYGSHIGRHLSERGLNVLGVDFNSAKVAEWQRQGLQGLCGDAEDPEYPGTFPLSQAHWVVSTIPQRDVNLTLLDSLHHYGYSGRKAVTVHSSLDAEILRESGADLILSPFSDAAKEAAEMLEVEKGFGELKG